MAASLDVTPVCSPWRPSGGSGPATADLAVTTADLTASGTATAPSGGRPAARLAHRTARRSSRSRHAEDCVRSDDGTPSRRVVGRPVRGWHRGHVPPPLPDRRASPQEEDVSPMKKIRLNIERALETFEVLAGYGTKRRKRTRR
ncbi:hypothetical protein GCM10023203_39510 [Actinomycetospora straminea]|uniref:Uncharacterized protein n=1 Tax=Actinomycetospora straminea TaxID=663607 RepID=A0ABP9EY36_9PSEU